MLGAMIRGWLSLVVLALMYACLQMFILVPDGFFAGDQGTKLLETRAVLRHGPIHPWIDVPRDIDPSARHQEPALIVRAPDSQVVSIFPWALPIVTAPFLRVLGLHGLYVVPALATLLTFAASARIGRAIGVPGVLAGWCAVAATPVVFYGAELWEHAPAVALTTFAAAMTIPPPQLQLRRWLAAGVAIGAAALFRPEAAVTAPAVAAGLVVFPGVRSRAAAVAALAFGVAVVTLAAVPMNLAVYGAILPPQVTYNAPLGLQNYWATRLDIVRRLFLPAWGSPAFCAALLAVAVSALARTPRRLRLLACVVFAGVMSVLALVVPPTRWALAHVSPLIAFEPASVAHTWLIAAAVPFLIVLPHSLNDRYLAVVAASFLLLAAFVIPNTGGAQWGARFFLPAAPLVGVIASTVLHRARGRNPQRVVTWVVAGLILASVTVQGLGIAVLRKHKSEHAQIPAAIARETQAGAVVISDLYWVPELAAPIYDARRLLYAPSREDLNAIALRAASIGIPEVAFVTSTAETGQPPPTVIAPASGVRFTAVSTSAVAVRGVTITVYKRYDRQH